MEKILFKQINGFISITWSLHREQMVKRWHFHFKPGRTDMNDSERSGHPNSTVVSELNLCEIA